MVTPPPNSAVVTDAQPGPPGFPPQEGPAVQVRIEATVVVAGELDLATRDTVTEAVGRVAGPGVTVTVDLAGIWFCDLAGARALLACEAQATAAGADFAVAHLPAEVRRVLDLARLPDLAVAADGTGPTDATT